MRVLFVLPYGPSETRVRSRMLLTELARRHEVTVVGQVWNAADRHALDQWAERGLDVRCVVHGLRDWLPSSYRAVRQPLQQVVASSPAFAREVRSAVATAREAGCPFDVVHVEHVRGAAASGALHGFGVRTVFDAVDCISELARLTRLNHRSRTARLVARHEEPRTAQLERALAGAVDTVTLAAERDAAAYRRLAPDARIEVITNGVDAFPVPITLTDEPVVVFTGKLSYHANQAAVGWFIDDIWPLVTQVVPDARLVVAGADPPRWLLAHGERASIRVVPNPPDMSEIIATARVAIAPMRYSVGIQNKILEAMAAGVPVVATSTARAGLGEAADGALLGADGPRDVAAAVIRLLIDDHLARQVGRDGYDYVREHHSWESTALQFEALYAPNRVLQWTV